MLSTICRRTTVTLNSFVQTPLSRSLCSNIKKYFSKDHEWVAVTGRSCVVGITDHAQKALGDVVFVELPDVGAAVEVNEKVGAVESVKAVSDIFSPASGTISAVNEELTDSPGLINKSCYAEGWLYKMDLSQMDELNELMDENQYTGFLKESDD